MYSSGRAPLPLPYRAWKMSNAICAAGTRETAHPHCELRFVRRLVCRDLCAEAGRR